MPSKVKLTGAAVEAVEDHRRKDANPAAPSANGLSGSHFETGEDVVLTDAEIAWKLHHELNAASSLLRTRSRKPQSAGNSAGGDKAGTVGSEDLLSDKSLGMKANGSGAKRDTQSAKDKHDGRGGGDGAVTSPIKQEAPGSSQPTSPRAPTHHDKDSTKEEAGSGPDAPPKPNRSRKALRPAAADTDTGLKLLDSDAAWRKANEEKQPLKAAPPPPPKLIKMPKLPMVRRGKKWYRARVLQETSESVQMEFAGYESILPTLWLPRISDRIWFGSYKGKDWRYLGDGAWEPKPGIKNRLIGPKSEPENDLADVGKVYAFTKQLVASKKRKASAASGLESGSRSPEPQEVDEEMEVAGLAEVATDNDVDPLSHRSRNAAMKRARASAQLDSPPAEKAMRTSVSDKKDAEDEEMRGEERPSNKPKRHAVGGGTPRGRRLDPIVRDALAAAAAADESDSEEDNDDEREVDEDDGGSAHDDDVVKDEHDERIGTKRSGVLKKHSRRGVAGEKGSPPLELVHEDEQGARRRRGRPGITGGSGHNRRNYFKGEDEGGDSESDEGLVGGRYGRAGQSPTSNKKKGGVWDGDRQAARPRRAAKRTAIYNDEDFAVDAEMDLVEPEHPGWYYVVPPDSGGVPNGTADPSMTNGVGNGVAVDGEMDGNAAAAAQPQRRRRKPVVSSPAPTDVGLPAGVLPEEFEALAALAEMPSPRSTTAAAQRDAIFDAYVAPATGAVGGSATTATHIQNGGYNNGVTKARRGMPPVAPSGGTSLDGPRPGRPRKASQHLNNVLGRSFSHSAVLERQSAHRRGGVTSNGGGAYNTTNHHGSTFRRSASLDYLSTAGQMFGRLLGAVATRLGHLQREDAAVDGMNHNTNDRGNRALERGPSFAAGGMRLFNNGWSQHRWVSSSGSGGVSSSPAILSVPTELFAALQQESSAAGPGGKPPMPLFC